MGNVSWCASSSCANSQPNRKYENKSEKMCWGFLSVVFCLALLLLPLPLILILFGRINWRIQLFDEILNFNETTHEDTNNKKNSNFQSSILILLSPSAAFFPLIFVITLPIHPSWYCFFYLSLFESHRRRDLRVECVHSSLRWSNCPSGRQSTIREMCTFGFSFLEVVVITVVAANREETDENKQIEHDWTVLLAEWNLHSNLTRTNSPHRGWQQSKSSLALRKLCVFFRRSENSNSIRKKTRRRCRKLYQQNERVKERERANRLLRLSMGWRHKR